MTEKGGMIKKVGTTCSVLVSVGLVIWAVYLSRIDPAEIANVAATEASNRLERAYASKSNDTALQPLFAEAAERVDGDAFGRPQKLYGYYGDLDKGGKTTNISRETYNLQFDKRSAEVVGEVAGLATAQEKPIQRRSAVRGVRRDSRMALTILGLPTKDDPASKGIGSYYLEKNGDDYTGTAIYLDCVNRIVQCPYAITSEDLNEKEVRARWPEVFNRQCEKLNLTPGFQLPTSCQQ